MPPPRGHKEKVYPGPFVSVGLERPPVELATPKSGRGGQIRSAKRHPYTGPELSTTLGLVTQSIMSLAV